MYKFYQELTFDDSIDHHKQEWSKDDPTSFRQWYYEDISGKDTLVITVGDSWTWGDHLGNIDWDKAVDDPIRLTQIFGRKLSTSMNADWVNLARPGCSNYWMLEKLQDIQHHLHRVKDQYKKIYLIITLTEDLREAQYTRRINVEQPYREFWDSSDNIRGFLKKVENYLFDNLEQYFNSVPFVEPLVSRAFTDSWQKRSWMVDKTWCDVIQDEIQFIRYGRPVPFIGQMSINPLKDKFITTDAQKDEFLDMMSVIETRWEFLGYSHYNLKGSTYHPNEFGHSLWAQYVRYFLSNR
jgi:hypothetical protein